jgi:hypothetical protein
MISQNSLVERDGFSACKKRSLRARQYKRLYVACLTVFVVVATVERLLPVQWRSRAAKGSQIMDQAREQAGTFVPYLFMNSCL